MASDNWVGVVGELARVLVRSNRFAIASANCAIQDESYQLSIRNAERVSASAAMFAAYIAKGRKRWNCNNCTLINYGNCRVNEDGLFPCEAQ